ncbi:hypothetical protein JAB5_11070 [Janthinobacterium sp. HH103]|nr:hypothetical protein JAB5_11070 [Janthinobacterium sp. HH103]
MPSAEASKPRITIRLSERITAALPSLTLASATPLLSLMISLSVASALLNRLRESWYCL